MEKRAVTNITPIITFLGDFPAVISTTRAILSCSLFGGGGGVYGLGERERRGRERGERRERGGERGEREEREGRERRERGERGEERERERERGREEKESD